MAVSKTASNTGTSTGETALSSDLTATQSPKTKSTYNHFTYTTIRCSVASLFCTGTRHVFVMSDRESQAQNLHTHSTPLRANKA